MTSKRQRYLWLSHQRAAFRDGYLSPDQIAKLKEAGFDFSFSWSSKKAEEWVPIAEDLASQNGGVLPFLTRLKGYRGLAHAMRKRPELFAHINRKKIRKGIDEWVKIAEKLAKEHNGVLPNGNCLKKNGFLSLYSAMVRHPDSFSHIKKMDNEHKSPVEWVKEAEKLAKEHDGFLPCSGWLQKNGYTGLAVALRKNPEVFSHIGRKIIRKNKMSTAEWVKIAEKLAKEHDGVLPCSGWLQKNGYYGLSKMMSGRPDLLKHIRQDQKNRRSKPPELWVPVAERLAKENGGVLPGWSWMIKNRYSRLYKEVKRNPELFAHIQKKAA